MSKIIRVKRGDRLSLKVRRKPRQSAQAGAADDKGPRGLLYGSDADARYIHRPKKGIEYSFYDLGTRHVGDELVTTTPGADQFEVGILNGLMLDGLDFEGTNSLNLPYHSEFLFTDAGASETLIVLGAPNQRALLSNIVAGTPLSTGNSWSTDAKLKLKTKTRLAVASLTYFIDFDTSDTTRFKVTTEPAFSAPAAPFHLSGTSARVFLVPAFWSWNLRDAPGPGVSDGAFFRVPAKASFAEPWATFGTLVVDGITFITIGAIPALLKAAVWTYFTTEVNPITGSGRDHIQQTNDGPLGYANSAGQIAAVIVGAHETFWVWSVTDSAGNSGVRFGLWTEEISG